MPELPEVEVVRQGLRDWVLNSKIENVQVFDPRSLRRNRGTPEQFIDSTTGATISNISRRGKYLWLTLDTGEKTLALVIHLGMSGQLLIKSDDNRHSFQTEPEPEILPQLKHLKVLFSCNRPGDQPVEVWFVDQRIFGGVYIDEITPTDDGLAAGWSEVPEPFIPASVAHIARDPLDAAFTAEDLFRRLRKTRTSIKRALLNQSIVSGIGNIYADEALFEAKLHYQRISANLTRAEVTRLFEASQEILRRSLAAGGTSFDALYVDIAGKPGYFARELQVYGRENMLCHRCARSDTHSVIKRETFMNRSSFFCPRCQPRPRNRAT